MSLEGGRGLVHSRSRAPCQTPAQVTEYGHRCRQMAGRCLRTTWTQEIVLLKEEELTRQKDGSLSPE